MKRSSKTAGISLVALVITIIVLIILTGAVIVTFMEGGIIDRAKESVFKNDMRTYQEILALKRAENQMEIALGEKEDVEINASTLAEIQAIIPEFKEEYEGLVVITKGELSIGERVTGEELSNSEEQYATWLDDLGIGLSRLPQNALASYVEVGDYVEYSPDGNNVTSYELLYDDSGYWEDQNNDTVYNEGEEVELQTIIRQNINWRVLKNDGRQVTLISETPIDSIGLGGLKGFLSVPTLLDEIYNELYSSSKTLEVRNLNEEDVNEAMGVVIGKDVKPCYYNKSGTKVEMESVATLGDAIDADSYDVSGWIMPNDNYRDYELYYYYRGSTYKTRNEEAYKLIFRNVADSGYASRYWLSSFFVDVNFEMDTAFFNVSGVDNDLVAGGFLYNANGYYEDINYCYVKAGRPIVILNLDVEVANPKAGGDSADAAWKLK